MVRRLVSAASLAVLLACEGSTDPIILTGTWTGTLSITIGGAPNSIPMTIILVQAGNAVTGTIQTFDDPEIEALSGTVNGNAVTITITTTQNPNDDCHLYSAELSFTVSGNTLTATGAGGVSCEGNGTGGHDSLDPLTAASGTLTKS